MRPVALLLGLIFGLSACQPSRPECRDKDCFVQPAFSVRDGTRITSPRGQVLLRGVNARVSTVFDVTFTDGRLPLEEIPPFTAEDARQVAAWGFNFLRLPVNWSALEPHRKHFDTQYVERIAQIVEICANAGIYVLIDFHQDAYSKEIGEDGAPLWAIEPPPERLMGGPLTDLTERRLSKQVLRAFESFFANARGLQDDFADAVAFLNRRFDDHPWVVGIEIFNEPMAPNPKLLPFYLKVIDRVRREDPDRLFFFEPDVMRNQTDKMPLSTTPFPRHGVVYAPHTYTDVFTLGAQNFASGDPAMLEPSMVAADREARSWGTPLLIGEFGIGPNEPNALRWIEAEVDLQNRFLAHSAFWVWKEASQGHWGLFDLTESGWKPREAVVKALAAPYPSVVAGKLLSLHFDRTTIVVDAEVRLEGEFIEWAVPSVWYPQGAQAECDGKPARPATLDPGLRPTACSPGTRRLTLRPVNE